MINLQTIAIRSIFIGMLGVMIAGCGEKNKTQESVDPFFSLLQKGDTAAAYESTTRAFQTAQTLQGFETQTRELGVAGFQALEWKSKVTQDKEMKWDGEITLKKGGKRILIATLIPESGRWRIYTLRMRTTREDRKDEIQFTQIGQSAAFNKVYKPGPPTNPDAVKLVRETLLKFNESIQQKNFEEFYQFISTNWRMQISLKRMTEAFHGFIDENIDLSPIKDAEIKLDEAPLINQEGFLIVRGQSKLPAYRVKFELTYNYELPKWKLSGIKLDCID